MTRPTARDVAGLAGVSVATVSYVLSGRDRPVGAETRRKVLEAAEQLGYTPNQAARSLRRRRTQRVCLVQGTVGGVPTDERVARDLHEMADALGFSVISLAVYSAARARAAQDLLLGRIADGALVNVSGEHLTYDMLTALTRSGLPMVVMRNEPVPEGCDVVRVPATDACREAVEDLLLRGRRRVAFIAHRSELYREEPSDRMRGYLQALNRHGAEPIVVPGADDRISGYRATADLLTRPDRPDAIFAASDRAAISAIWAVRDAGLRVPEDVAVVGVGNIDEGLITKPPLSTVGPVTYDFTEVVRLLFDRLQAEDPPPVREIVRPWTFLRRGTS
ncbi:LacI family DNA-binding transcriptional regulator [Streptosporangium sp. KLBMP 9127]|nr:LacI family transcriptional regulator [Streptosporangium sp. KLBMP 9127]